MGSRTNVPDLAFAAFLVALGAFALVLGSELTVGTAGAMGPGYVPRALSVLIILMGLGMGGRALLARRQPFPAVGLRPLLLIGSAVALFAALLPLVGLALTSLVVVVCAGFASAELRLRENALLAIGLAAFAVALFVYGLGLPIRVWP